MSNLAIRVAKKVSMETFYELIDERTSDTRKTVEQIKTRQEDDSRYLGKRIDNLGQRLDTRMDALDKKLDTVIQLIMTMQQQVMNVQQQIMNMQQKSQ